MEMLRLESKNIRVESSVAPGSPPVWGNSNQLFRCCLEIIGNAADALHETGGGVFRLSSRLEGDDVVLEFSDSGPGIRDPQRVFDPFYTTKPIGKGAGLGLSATYGVVQDHHPKREADGTGRERRASRPHERARLGTSGLGEATVEAKGAKLYSGGEITGGPPRD